MHAGKMTVRDLIEYLEQYDDNAEVRLGTQSHYPLQYGIQSVVAAGEIASYDDPDPDEDDEDTTVTDFDGPVSPETVYLIEGDQLGYFSKDAWR